MRLHRKSILLRILALLAIAGLAGPMHCLGQAGQRSDVPGDAIAKPQYRAMRLIEDPSTHLRWMLMKDAAHPEWPARLEPFANTFGAPGSTGGTVSLPSRKVAMIHAGDALTITRHSEVSDVRLEAIALGPAAIGELVRVRLKTSGRVLSVVADGAGRATMLTDGNEVRW